MAVVFKSAIPSKIPDLYTLYKKANNLLDSQYTIINKNIFLLNHWIIGQNLALFKLNLDNIDRLYSFDDNFQTSNGFTATTLRVRVQYEKKQFYVIFSQFEREKDQLQIGWMLITTNFNFFIKDLSEDERDFIYKFSRTNNDIEEIKEYVYEYQPIKPCTTNDRECFDLVYPWFPESLQISFKNVVVARDFGFITFYTLPTTTTTTTTTYFDNLSNVFCKFDIGRNSYISSFNDREENINHPNFKSAVSDIDTPNILSHLIGTDLDYQYNKRGRTIIPHHSWIYEKNLEFFKLNIKDINRLYLFSRIEDKWFLGARVEYDKREQFLYVIYFHKGNKGHIIFTTVPYLFADALNLFVKEYDLKLNYPRVSELLLEEEEGGGGGVIEFKPFQVNPKQQLSDLEWQSFGICEYHLKNDWYQSRIFNKFTNKIINVI